jgi:anti-sigma regulatory factor (Ser/Thr protein kinase)
MICKEYNVAREDFQNAGKVSSEIKKLLNSLMIPSPILRRIAVACYEAEINMIIHSYGGVIKLLMDDEDITLIFEDIGPGIEDIEKALEKGYSTASVKARELGFGAGMGLYNIKRMADEFDLNSRANDKTILTIKFKV